MPASIPVNSQKLLYIATWYKAGCIHSRKVEAQIYSYTPYIAALSVVTAMLPSKLSGESSEREDRSLGMALLSDLGMSDDVIVTWTEGVRRSFWASTELGDGVTPDFVKWTVQKAECWDPRWQRRKEEFHCEEVKGMHI